MVIFHSYVKLPEGRLYVAYLGLNHEHSHLVDDYTDDKQQKHHSHSHETYRDRIYMNIIYLVNW